MPDTGLTLAAVSEAALLHDADEPEVSLRTSSCWKAGQTNEPKRCALQCVLRVAAQPKLAAWFYFILFEGLQKNPIKLCSRTEHAISAAVLPR